MSVLHIETLQGARPETTILRLDGPLLIAHVPNFRKAAQTAQTPLVIVDFTQASYMDSTGLGAVLQLYRQIKAENRRLVLVGLNQRVAALLKLTRVDTLLEIQPSAEDAEKTLA
jgi:anti-sigma B factor antagonist